MTAVQSGQMDLFEWAKAKGVRRTRADQIFASFVRFHVANPRVWALFKRFAFEAILSGRENYSSDCVCHRIRWNSDIETSGSDVKINNNFTAYYARMFHCKYRRHDGFFRNRRRISETHGAHAVDLEVWESDAPGDESELMLQLAALVDEPEHEGEAS